MGVKAGPELAPYRYFRTGCRPAPVPDRAPTRSRARPDRRIRAAGCPNARIPSSAQIDHFGVHRLIGFGREGAACTYHHHKLVKPFLEGPAKTAPGGTAGSHHRRRITP